MQKVQNELMTFDLLPEEFGGDTQVAMVSAKQKSGLDELLEKILLQSEVLELKSNPDRSAEGVIIEARMERGLGKWVMGFVATFFVKMLVNTLVLGLIVSWLFR